MAFTDASRPAAVLPANGPRELAHTGKRRGSFATTLCQKSKAFPRITGRVENHIREVESRIIRLGQLVDVDQVDRSMIVERLEVAIELARLEGASFEPKIELQNCSSMSEAEAPGFTEEEIERAAAVHEGEQRPIKSRHQIYYAENREKVRERQRLHYIANREARRERQRKFYAEHRERELKRLQRFYFRNRAHVLEKKRAAYSARTKGRR